MRPSEEYGTSVLWDLYRNVGGDTPYNPGPFEGVAVHLALAIATRWSMSVAAAGGSLEFDGAPPAIPADLRRSWWDDLGSQERERVSSVFSCEWFPAWAESPEPMSEILRRSGSEVRQVVADFGPRYLHGICRWLDGQPWGGAEDRETLAGIFDDILADCPLESECGDAMDHCVLQSDVAELMVRLADPQDGERIWVPRVGVGEILVQLDRFWRQQHPAGTDRQQLWQFVAGTEGVRGECLVSFVRLLLRGILAYSIRPQSAPAVEAEPEPPKGVDCVLAQIFPGEETRFPVGTDSSCLQALQHVMLSLAPKGRAVVLLPEGILYQEGPEERVRRRLLEEFTVEHVLRFPPHETQPKAQLPQAVLLFRRATPPGRVFFVQAPRLKRPGEEPAIVDVERTLALCRDRTETPVSWAVPPGDLSKRRSVLTVPRPSDGELDELLGGTRAAMPATICCQLKEVAAVWAGTAIDAGKLCAEPPAQDARPSGTAGYTRVISASEMAAGDATPALFLPAADNAGGPPHMPGGHRHSVTPEDKRLVRSGDVLVVAAGCVGESQLPEETVDALALDDLHVVRPIPGGVVRRQARSVAPGYLYGLLQTPVYRSWMREHAVEDEGVLRLPRGTLMSLPVPVPPLEAQIQVAFFLGCAGGSRDVLSAFSLAAEMLPHTLAGQRDGEADTDSVATDLEDLRSMFETVADYLREATMIGAPYAPWLSQMAGLIAGTMRLLTAPPSVASLLQLQGICAAWDSFEEEGYDGGGAPLGMYLQLYRLDEILSDARDRMERLQRGAKSLSQFEIVSVLTHNLNNKVPVLRHALDALQHFIVDSGLAAEPVDGTLDCQGSGLSVGEVLDLARGNLQRMSSVISDTRDVITRQIDPDRFEDVCVLDLLRGRLDSRRLGEPTFELVVEGVSAKACIDADTVIEALENMMRNAQDHAFGPGPGNVFRVTVSLNDEDKVIDVRCRNNGKPFPREITRDFYTMPAKSTKSSRGTGCGGAWVGRVMEAHRGSISIVYPEDGADITLRFPISSG